MENPVLYIVIPCYNEQEVLPITAPMFLNKLHELAEKKLVSENSRILFVNDGSSDGTWAWRVIRALAASDEHSHRHKPKPQPRPSERRACRTYGAQDRCDISISIRTAPGQDVHKRDGTIWFEPISTAAISSHGVRNDRETDSFFKRTTAQGFYRFLSAMGAEIVYNQQHYRLISARALHELAKFKEVNLFLRGMVPLVGFKSTSVEYKRAERIAGKSKYPLRKMLALAGDGITSLSIKPLRLIMSFGVIVALLSFVGVIWAIVAALAGRAVAGWASMTCIICFVSGVQLICMGIIGEYIGKIYMETKQRPRYIISERTWKE